MQNPITMAKIFLGLALVSFIAGFFICATSPSNVFIGIAVTLIGATVFGGVASVYAAKYIHNREKEKEDRIKNLENEAAQLKRKG